MSRFSVPKHFKSFKPLMDLSAQIHASSLEGPLRELVLMRVSQMNGCAYCLDMHSKDALAAGETSQRLFVLPAWREATFYSERERAALAWAEALTRLDGAIPVTDALYEEASKQFSEDELVMLTLLVTMINSWNRLNIAAHTPSGTYQPGKSW
ncbi:MULTISPECIES: carboxymuconolactone decarboxylase family protein [Dyella]|uniref:Carboxymuconolactone decarboxylase family protein n=2 Tax=Dyella TaxID=231454 RepID=A0A4R0Z0X0_9GAMM|nr:MULTISPECIES: carboxymuconolactone decarboxylase family protein [Dyella]TBR38999.1 carboxymuconolactone decarboxylase family protein [Dyella terrae]TCI13409.1 carboxymuconolactone decarboxylase family protein [Dyella soli]